MGNAENSKNTETMTFRMSPDVKARVSKIIENCGTTNVDLFIKMLDCYEWVALKDEFPGMADLIDSTQAAIKTIEDNLKAEAQLAKNAKDVARKELRIELETSTQTIANLQKEKKESEEKFKKLSEANAVLIAEKANLIMEIAELKKAIQDQKDIIHKLTDMAQTIEAVQGFINSKELEPLKE